MRALIADRSSDGGRMRARIVDHDTKPVGPSKSNCGVVHQFGKPACWGEMSSSAAFAASRTSVASRHDKLARNFLAAVHLAALVAYWFN
jgi:hypothetical protein